MKKLPLLDREYIPRFAAIPKAVWCDLYADLFRVTHGEACTDEQVMHDAETRLAMLKANRFYDE